MSWAVLANLVGRSSSALIALIFIPIYLHLMGPASYGVVGFYNSLTWIVLVFDGGVMLTVNRELARLSAQPGMTGQMQQTFGTALAILTVMAGILVLAVWLAAPWIALHWLSAGDLPPQEVVLSIRLMGVLLAEQLFASLHVNALLGLHRQISVNVIVVLAAILRSAGVVAVLIFVSPASSALLFYFALVFVFMIVSLRLLLARDIPLRGSLFVPSKPAVTAIVRQGVGLAGITVISLLLLQIDKLVVSGVLPIAQVGYYVAAASIAQVPQLITIAVTASTFPQFSRLAFRDEEAAQRMLLVSAQIIAATAFPIAATFMFFGNDIALAWTGNLHTASQISVIAALLTLGNALNGIVSVANFYEIAHHRTKKVVYMLAVGVLILTPALFVGAVRYGGVGAAMPWPIVNIGFLMIGLPIIMRGKLKGGLVRFYLPGLALPAIASLLIAGLVQLLIPDHLGRWACAGTAVGVLIACLIASWWVLPALRGRVIHAGRTILVR